MSRMVVPSVSCRTFLFLLSACFLVGCVGVEHVRYYTGGLRYGVQIPAPNTKTRVIGPSQKSRGCRIAVFPLMNTSQITQRLDVDLSYANQQITSALQLLDVREGCKIIPPNDAQRHLSEAGLTATYSDMLDDYDKRGLIDVVVVQKIAEKMNIDLLLQGTLISYDVDTSKDVFNRATIRFIAFNGRTGDLEWNIETTGAKKKMDSRSSTYETLKNRKAAGIYTAVAVGISVIGAITLKACIDSGNEDGQTAGAVMLTPILTIPLAWIKKEPTHRSVGKHHPIEQPMRIDEGLKAIISYVLTKIFEEHIVNY